MKEIVRVLHVTESHSFEDGGVTSVVNALTQKLSERGVYSCVAAGTDNEEFTPEGVDFVRLGSRAATASSLFLQDLKKRIKRIVLEKNISVIHIHGFWLPQQLVAGRVAKEMGIPFILTSHGMLEPWLWRGKGFLGYVKKKAFFYLFAYNVYKSAKVIHAITLGEEQNLKKLFPSNDHCLISNAIEINSEQLRILDNEKIIFYIGRINPKKGVILLLRAFKELCLSGDWKLYIAGPEEVPEYAEKLKDYVREHDLNECVRFIGPVYEDEKKSLYMRSWITVVPSYSEVVGLVNLEAASLFCPTVTTYETGLLDWEDGGGLLVSPNVKEIKSALKSVVLWNQEERTIRGRQSYKLVKSKYSWETAAEKWVELYFSVVGGDL